VVNKRPELVENSKQRNIGLTQKLMHLFMQPFRYLYRFVSRTVWRNIGLVVLVEIDKSIWGNTFEKGLFLCC